MKKLTPEEISNEINFEDDCGVNTLLQEIVCMSNEGKNGEVWKDEKGKIIVKEI